VGEISLPFSFRSGAMTNPPISFEDITLGGAGIGKFRGDSEQIGWQSADRQTLCLWKIDCIKQAEWFEGQMKMLVEPDDGSDSEVVGLSGFQAPDYDKLWKHLNGKGVFIKKVEKKGSTNTAEFDAVLVNIEAAADEVDRAEAGTVSKKAREGDLLGKLEQVRDGLDKVIRGDKQALSAVFAANGCERIGRLRLVINTVQVEMFKTDQRWTHIRNQTRSIEGVLKSLGTFRVWQPSEDSRLAKRQTILDLRRAQGLLCDSSDEDEEPPRAAARSLGERREMPAIDVRALLPPGGDPLARQRSADAAAAREAEERRAATWSPTSATDAVVVTSSPLDRGRAASALADSAGYSFNSAEAARKTAEEAEEARRLLNSIDEHAPAPNASENIIEGWVYKKSRHLKQWRRRWLVLTATYLATFATNASETKPTEMLETGTVSDVRCGDVDTGQSGSIAVVAAKRTYLIVLDDKTKKNEWITKLKGAFLLAVR